MFNILAPKESTLSYKLREKLWWYLVSIATHSKTIVDPKEVESRHKVRVAIRRLDALLSAFHAYIDRSQIESDLNEINRVRKTCGKVRDLDLFIALLEQRESGGEKPDDYIARVIGNVAKERKAEIRKLKIAIKPLPGRKILKPLDERFESAILGSAETEQFAIASRSILQPMIARYLQSAREVETDPMSTEAWHQLRIEGKYLRYLLEEMQTTPIVFATLIRLLKQSQDDIGAMHDCDGQLVRIDSILHEAKHPARAAMYFTPTQNHLRSRWEESRMKALRDLPMVLRSMRSLSEP